MPRVRIGPALPDREQLDVGELRNRWRAVFGRPAPTHLPRHLLFRLVAYRLQADRFGDLDSESQRLLDHSGSPEKAGQSAVDLVRRIAGVRPGTVLGREWNGRMQRVAVRALCLEWQDLSEPVAGRVRHYRHPLERAKVLRSSG